MSHQLPDEYWESLGPNGPFLRELFHNQSQLVTQLQAANNDLETQVMDALDDVANVASQAMSAVAQTVLKPTCKHLWGASCQGTLKLPTRRPSMGAEGRPNS